MSVRVALEDRAACLDLTVGGRVLDSRPGRLDRCLLGAIGVMQRAFQPSNILSRQRFSPYLTEKNFEKNDNMTSSDIMTDENHGV